MTRIDTTDATGFSPAAIKPRVSIGDIDKLDIRVGTIERVENVPKSDKLVKLTVNFGDHKRSYLEALARYWQISLAATREALADDRPLNEALMLAYEAALSIYFSGDGGPRGCFDTLP